MKHFTDKIEKLLELGGVKKDITFLIISAIALIISIFGLIPAPFDFAWVAIILCGIPIILEAVTGLITAFDIKADVLVSLALIASVIIGEDFAAGEVAFIMQLGALLDGQCTSVRILLPQSRGKGMGMESLLAQQLLARLTQWDKGAYVEYC